MLEQYRISDFVEWHSAKSLVLNPSFQRGAVWTPAARIYLIDTILRELPIPKIYMRSFIDRDTKKTKREVVDGQQRLRTIIDFASDRITLSTRAKEFSGLKFSTLPIEAQDSFLQYPISVDQLVNANDKDVIDIFTRLNSYNVRVNPPELRHAECQSDFKWSVHDSASSLYSFWKKYSIFSEISMVRMLADLLVAEMYLLILDGVTDGGQPNITKRYRTLENDIAFDKINAEHLFNIVISYIRNNLADRLSQTVILQPPHLLMLFAALAHVLIGISIGKLDEIPEKESLEILDLNKIADNLLELSVIITANEEPVGVAAFWRASTSSTQRIASHKTRFFSI